MQEPKIELTSDRMDSLSKQLQDLYSFLNTDIEDNSETEEKRELANDFTNKFTGFLKQVKIAVLEQRILKLALPAETQQEALSVLPMLISKDTFYTLPPNVQLLLSEHHLNIFDERDIAAVYDQLLGDNRENFGETAKRGLTAVARYFHTNYLNDKQEKINSWLTKLEDKEYEQEAGEKLSNLIDAQKENVWLAFKFFIPTEQTEHDLVQEKSLEAAIFNVIKNGYLFNEAKPDAELLIKYYAVSSNTKQPAENSWISVWQKISIAYNQLDSEDLQSKINLLKAFANFWIYLEANFNVDSPEEGVKTLYAISRFVDLNEPNLKSMLDEQKKNILQELKNQLDDKSNAIYKGSFLSDVMKSINDPSFVSPDLADDSNLLKNFVKDELEKMRWGLKALGIIGFTLKERLELDSQSDENNNDSPVLVEFFKSSQYFTSMLEKAKEAINSQLQYFRIAKHQRQEFRNPDRPDSALGGLKLLPRGDQLNPNNEQMDSYLEQAAAFKFRVNKQQYRLSKEEINLLAELTMIPVTNLIPFKENQRIINYPAGTLSYQEYIAEINNKKQQILEHNNSRICTWLPFLKKSVVKYDIARNYIIYHHYKLTHTKMPENRLNPVGIQGSHRSALDNVSHFRINLQRIARKLNTLFGANRNLKKLNKLFEAKTKFAKSLKDEVIILNKSNKKWVSDDIYRKFVRTNNDNSHIEETKPCKEFFTPYSLAAQRDIFTSEPPASNQFQASFKAYFYLQQQMPTIKQQLALLKAQTQKLGLNIVPCNQQKEIDAISTSLLNAADQLPENFSIELEKLPKINAQSKVDDFAHCLKQLSLIDKSAEQVVDELRQQILASPLKFFKQFIKTATQHEYETLMSSLKLPDDFDDSPSALNQIGQTLRKCKKNKQSLKRSAINYLNVLQMEIVARNEVLIILSSLNTSKNPNEALKLLSSIIKEINNNLTKIPGDETTIITAESIANSKLLEKIDELKCLYDQLEVTNDQGLGDQAFFEKLETLISDYGQQNQALIEVEKQECDKIKGLVEASKQTIESLTYLCDHNTDMFCGIRAGR
jgi:hypothetical protein